MAMIGWIIIGWAALALAYALGWISGASTRSHRPQLDATDLALHQEADRGEWLCDIDRARMLKRRQESAQ